MESQERRSRTWPARQRKLGILERLTKVAFCDRSTCLQLASWRVGYGRHEAVLCSPHAVAMMRNQRVWGVAR